MSWQKNSNIRFIEENSSSFAIAIANYCTIIFCSSMNIPRVSTKPSQTNFIFFSIIPLFFRKFIYWAYFTLYSYFLPCHSEISRKKWYQRKEKAFCIKWLRNIFASWFFFSLQSFLHWILCLFLNGISKRFLLMQCTRIKCSMSFKRSSLNRILVSHVLSQLEWKKNNEIFVLKS